MLAFSLTHVLICFMIPSMEIGQGGSYSLLWHQWGHTFSDYVHADKRMTEPQKTLRSLGLIKGNGWNYITSLSMRMSNEDTGMTSDSLDELLEEGGLWFLPRSWQDVEEEDSDISDFHAFGIGVTKRVEAELKRFYIMGLVVYVSAFFILVMLQPLFGIGTVSKQSKLSITSWLLFRIAAIHIAIVLLAWFALNTIDNTNWGKSIRNRKLYRVSVANLGDPANGTIPYKDDILNVSDYSSDYMASYTGLINVAHPGNAHWRTVTKSCASSYSVLTEIMKKSFCALLIDEVTTNRRFLKQDEERFWIEVVDMDELIKSCHRDITTANDPMLENLIAQIDSLRSEAKFGKFRTTTMNSKTILDYLGKWERRLLESSSANDAPIHSFSPNKKAEEKTTIGKMIRSQTRGEFLTRKISSISFRSRTIPQLPHRAEPFYGAWLKEGDRVLGSYDCDVESDVESK